MPTAKAEFRVLAALPADDTGLGLLEIASSDLPAVVTAMDDRLYRRGH